MTGMSDYAAKAALEWGVGKTAMPAKPTIHLALMTAMGIDDGTGFTEVSGATYARQNVSASFAAATGSAPSSITSNADVTFPSPTTDWAPPATPIVGWALYDALTNGNMIFSDYLGAYDWVPVTVSAASPGVITAKGHGFANGDKLVYSTEAGGTAPTFSQSTFTGLLTVANVTTDTFTLTNGGTAVNTSATGSGFMRKVVTQSVVTGVTFKIPSGSLVIKQS